MSTVVGNATRSALGRRCAIEVTETSETTRMKQKNLLIGVIKGYFKNLGASFENGHAILFIYLLKFFNVGKVLQTSAGLLISDKIIITDEIDRYPFMLDRFSAREAIVKLNAVDQSRDFQAKRRHTHSKDLSWIL